MELRQLSILLGIVVMLMAGCHHEHEYDARLLEAEGLAELYPDSALRLLAAVDSARLGEADMALYVLVKTDALCNTDLRLASDSLSRMALDYFSRQGNPLRLSRAYCIRGEICYYRSISHPEQISEAMVCFYKAKDVAEAHGFHLEAGRAWSGMANMALDRSFNSMEAYKYAHEELQHFRQCDAHNGIVHALLCQGRALSNLGKLDEAERIWEEMMGVIDRPKDEEWYVNGLRLKAFIAHGRNNYMEAYDLFSEVSRSKVAFTDDTLNRGAMLMWSGDMEGGRTIMESVRDSSGLYRWGNRILADYYAETGDYRKAFGLIRESYNSEQGSVNQILNNTTLSQLSSHYELTQQLDRAEVERARWRMWFIIVVSAVVVGGVTACFVWLHRRHRRVVADKIRLAEDLKETLGQSREELERIRSDYDASRAEADRAMASARTLLHGRYEMLETLTELVTRNSLVKGDRARLADDVTRLIEDYSGPTERYAELERQADSLFDNLITDFRHTIQGLKEPDYRLYLFSVMGLSNQTIAALLKENRLSAVYDRRRRLKDRIRQADPADRDRFLSYL